MGTPIATLHLDDGTLVGAQMSYDAEGQLVHWQHAPGSSGGTLGSGGYTTRVNVLYDGEGNRVETKGGGSYPLALNCLGG